VLVATAGAGVALAVDASTFAVSAGLLVALRLPDIAPPPVRPFISELREGWREFRARDWVWGIVLGASLANMLVAGYQVLGPVVADRELGGAAAWATIATGFGIGSLIGGLVILHRPVRRPLLVGQLAGSIWVMPWILLAFLAPVGVIAAGAVLAGAGLMIFNALWEASLQAHIPAESLSRVSAYDWLGSLALNPLGAALIGPIAAGLGIRATLIACAALATLVNVFVLMLPGVRTTENPAASPAVHAA
jgi:hypothetical protein